ncbi:PaaI family thioesterase [Blattabacterium cuenoti]|uniref:PaaI family thioesterase n=1 Tax=Blattabacterium cuenoti TaxID=1653831 RepID=UPI00163D02EC|nr:hotdog fold thioesterase [Blattabacterium cuenoti]
MKKSNKEILKELNFLNKNTFISFLKIKYIDLGKNFLIAKMAIDQNKLQPIGFLHGGATLSLAESVSSSLSNINIDQKKFNIFNIEISANHIRKIKSGFIFAMAKIVYKGRRIHFLKTKIYNEKKDTISYCKMTNIIIPKINDKN